MTPDVPAAARSDADVTATITAFLAGGADAAPITWHTVTGLVQTHAAACVSARLPRDPGASLLQRAVNDGLPGLVGLLLARGARPQPDLLLHCAAAAAPAGTAVAALLLRHGADPDGALPPPLWAAAICGNEVRGCRACGARAASGLACGD
jgi:hypothetical protein